MDNEFLPVVEQQHHGLQQVASPIRPQPQLTSGTLLTLVILRVGDQEPTRSATLHTAAGVVKLVLWNVGCWECGRVFAPLLVMLGLSVKRRTDRLTVNLAELGTQVSFARAAELSRELAGTRATAGPGAQRAGRHRRAADRHRRHSRADRR